MFLVMLNLLFEANYLGGRCFKETNNIVKKPKWWKPKLFGVIMLEYGIVYDTLDLTCFHFILSNLKSSIFNACNEYMMTRGEKNCLHPNEFNQQNVNRVARVFYSYFGYN
jgi:hypothetical protein